MSHQPILSRAVGLAVAGLLGATAWAAPDPAADTAAGSLALTLADAVQRGLEHNLAALLAEQQVASATGAARAARARLWPGLDAELSENRTKINLEAYGFPVAPGESPLIGPFNVFDARLSSSAPIWDQRVRAGARSARATADAAHADLDDVRDQVVLAVSSLYLEAVAAEARVAALQSQVDSAASLAEQARDMKASGLVARVDVLRAEVQLAAEQQRQIVASNHAATSKLSLARAIGLPLDRTLELVDRPSYRPTLALTPAAALQRALANRADLAALDASLEAARQELRAAKGGGLPSLVAHGDVGRIGPSPSTAETTYTIGAALRVPLFTGGEVAGRVEQAQARITALEARRVDLSQRIELEVRTALLDLGAADARVRVAQRATGVADAQLEQTRDRFAAGVADGVEVVQAQEAVATAHENQIASLLAFNRAQVVLARALGIAADDLAGSTEPGGQP